MKHHYARIPAVLAALAISTTTLATNVTTTQAINEDVIEITSTRLLQSLKRTVSPVTVIDKTTLVESGYISASEALRHVAGIQIASSGGSKQLASIFSRGTDTRHTLVMLDGLPINQLQSGSTRLEDIPVQNIERIEIIKGAQSHIYGSDVMGAVINIITVSKKPTNSISTQFGTEGTINSQLTLADTFFKGTLQTTVGQQHTDGIDNLSDGDKDGNEQYYAMLNATQPFGAHIDTFLNGLFSKGKQQFDGYPGDSRYTQHNAQLGADIVTGDLQSRIKIFDQVEKRKSFGKGAFWDISETNPNHYNFQRTGAQITSEWSPINLASVLIGGDYQNNSIAGTKDAFNTTYNRNREYQSGGFLTLRGELDFLSVDAGVRYDDHSQFGSYTNYSLGLYAGVTDNLSAFAKYATTAKAPTFDLLYAPYYSNPNLTVEESEQSEIGLEWTAKNLSVSAIGFYNTFENLIQNDTNFIPQNVAEALITGAELEATLTSNQWQHALSYSYTDAQNKETKRQLARRAHNQLTLSNRFQYNSRLSYNLTTYAQSHSYNPSATMRYAGFVTQDIGAQVKLANNVSLGATIQNIFDHEYYTNDLFGTPYNELGRTFMFSIRKTGF